MIITIDDKIVKVNSILRDLGRVAVAFSGGVDSSLLLALSVEVLGRDKVLAFTADSPLLTARDRANTQAVANQLGVAVQFLPFDELTIAAVANNVPDRCYHCKRARFEALIALATASGAQLVHGENTDDSLDYRPGLIASRELGVRAPLAEAGLNKAEVREIAHRMGLPNWEQPSDACLATRFPANTKLTVEGLSRVQGAESALRNLLGSVQVRLRDHGTLARLEVSPAVITDLAQEPLRSAIVQELKALGYRYVALDLEGYRTGSTNERQ
ncbi:MAG: ATP-dependent sacrificial sulfur transferase LarE [Anaerolineae bacterium]